jgi:2-methylisocitrate lyase-like PEP mutase family enzyme
MKQTAGISQQEKAKKFYELHHSGNLLVLPNIWDCIGALLLEDLNYPAIATASASIAFSNGYDDGEHISFNNLLSLLKRISSCVNAPVTADIESGYAENNHVLKENIKQLIATGIVGINIEDTDKKTSTILSAEQQCERIQLIKELSKEIGVPLFINARTDVYYRGKGFASVEAKMEEAIKRGIAYKAAGADCFFPLAVQKEADIKKIIDALQIPLNIILIPGVPSLSTLHQIGVARVSLGPGFLKYAVRAMKDLAVKLQHKDGLTDITENEITSDYMKSLVNKG